MKRSYAAAATSKDMRALYGALEYSRRVFRLRNVILLWVGRKLWRAVRRRGGRPSA